MYRRQPVWVDTGKETDWVWGRQECPGCGDHCNILHAKVRLCVFCVLDLLDPHCAVHRARQLKNHNQRRA